MSKQEEIKEELKEYLRPNLKYEDEDCLDRVVYMVLDKLRSKDVMIRVESRLPPRGLWIDSNRGWLRPSEVQAIMDLAVEPLIKEKP